MSAVLTAYEMSPTKANVIASADLRRVARVLSAPPACEPLTREAFKTTGAATACDDRPQGRCLDVDAKRRSRAALQNGATDPRRIFRACRFGLRSQRAVCEAIAFGFSYHPKPRSRSRSGWRGPDGCQTFFNQIPPDLPVFEGRKQEPVRLFTVQTRIARESSLPRVIRGSLQFAS